MIGVWHSHETGSLKGKDIHHVGDIAIVGKEVPVLGFLQSEQLALRVELEFIWLFVIPSPAGIATSADAACARIVRVLSLAIYGKMAVYPLLFVIDTPSAFGGDVHGERAILVVPLFFIGKVAGKVDAVYVGNSEWHRKIVFIPIGISAESLLIVSDYIVFVFSYLKGKCPVNTAVCTVYAHPLLSIGRRQNAQ